MPLIYKIDVLQALKNKGFSAYELRKNRFLSEATIQRLRQNEGISWESIEMICQLLQCQPNDFLFFTLDCNGPWHWVELREQMKREKAEERENDQA